MNIDSKRKDEHVELAEKQYVSGSQSDFQKVRFVHHSFPKWPQKMCRFKRIY